MAVAVQTLLPKGLGRTTPVSRLPPHHPRSSTAFGLTSRSSSSQSTLACALLATELVPSPDDVRRKPIRRRRRHGPRDEPTLTYEHVAAHAVYSALSSCFINLLPN
jgi:hypothetical protein